MRAAALCVLVALCARPAHASADPVFARVAQEKAVSARLLYAMAVAESGRGGRPWPWTLNVDGRSRYYASRGEAHADLVRWLRQGVRSIDVGYMQVNLAHNGARFENTWLALDPYRNVLVAAEILRENFQACGEVPLAVAHYHSRTPWRAERYFRRVLGHYARSPGAE